MKKYYKMAAAAMQVQTSYSAWYWASTFSTIVRLLIMYFFWKAVYANQHSIQDMNLESMLTYIVVAMFLQMFVSGVGKELVSTIKDGNVAIELMRPYDLILKLIALDFGGKFMFLIREALPLAVLSIFFLDISLPGSLGSAVLFLFSAFCGIWIGTFLDLLIAILAFWTVNVWGLEVLKESVISFFSGALVPIILFPGWFQEISQFLPFQAMVYVPVSIYTGIISGTQVYTMIGIQLFWMLAMYFSLRIIWSLALRKVTIFGG